MKYLIDTNWVIDAQHNQEEVVQRLEELAPTGLGISIISLTELYEGILGDACPEKSEQALRKFLSSIKVLPVDEMTCRIFSRERRRLRALRQLPKDLDILMGATVIQHNLTILTNNRKDFERLEGLSIISV